MFFFLVPNVSPTCSHHVVKRFPSFQCVPQHVPNSTSVLLHMICPKFNSHVYKLKRYVVGKYICFSFATRDPKRCFHWGVINIPKKLLMGQSIWLLQKKKKSYGCSHELINMNHTMSSQLRTMGCVNNFAMTSLLFTLTNGIYICYVRLLYHLGLLCYKILIVIHLFAYYPFI